MKLTSSFGDRDDQLEMLIHRLAEIAANLGRIAEEPDIVGTPYVAGLLDQTTFPGFFNH